MPILKLEQLVQRMTITALRRQLTLLKMGLLLRFFASEFRTVADFGAWSNATKAECCEFLFDVNGREIGFLSWENTSSANQTGTTEVKAIDLLRYEVDVAYARSLHVLLVTGAVVADTQIHIGSRCTPQRRQRTLLRRYRAPSPPLADEAQEILTMRAHEFTAVVTLAECCDLLQHSRLHTWQPARAYLSKLRDLIATHQLKIYRDSRGPGGLLTWAWLSDDASSRIKDRPLHALHFSEWREGRVLCFCDAVAAPHFFGRLYEDILTNLFPEQRHVMLYRHPASGRGAELIALDRAAPEHTLMSWIQPYEA